MDELSAEARDRLTALQDSAASNSETLQVQSEFGTLDADGGWKATVGVYSHGPSNLPGNLAGGGEGFADTLTGAINAAVLAFTPATAQGE